MKRTVMALSVLMASGISIAAPINHTYNALGLEIDRLGQVVRVVSQNYTNLSGHGDNGGYVSFNLAARFDATMYLVGMNYNTGELSPTPIAIGDSDTPISGYLDPIAGYSGYTLIVAPSSIPFNQLTSDNSELFSGYIAPYDAEYTITGIEPSIDYSNAIARPIGAVTLNELALNTIASTTTNNAPTAQIDAPTAQIDAPTAQIDAPTAQIDAIDAPTATLESAGGSSSLAFFGLLALLIGARRLA